MFKFSTGKHPMFKVYSGEQPTSPKDPTDESKLLFTFGERLYKPPIFRSYADALIWFLCMIMMFDVTYVFFRIDRLETTVNLIAENITADMRYLEVINKYNLEVIRTNKETDEKKLLLQQP